MGRENLSGTAVVALLASGLALTLTLSACSEMSNDSAGSAEVTVSRAKKNVEDPKLVFDVQLTDKLPYPLSKNYATGLQFTGKALQSGHKFMPKPPRRPSPGVRVDVLATPSHQKTIRMQMAYAKLLDVFGETEASLNRKKVIWLQDTESQHWFSIGYMGQDFQLPGREPQILTDTLPIFFSQ